MCLKVTQRRPRQPPTAAMARMNNFGIRLLCLLFGSVALLAAESGQTNTWIEAINAATAQWAGPMVEPADLALLRGEKPPPRASVPEAAERLAKCRKALAANRVEEATNLIFSVIREFPSSAETVELATNGIYESLMSTGLSAICDAVLVAVLRTSPRDNEAWGEMVFARCRALYRAGRFREMSEVQLAMLAWDEDHPCSKAQIQWGSFHGPTLDCTAMAGSVAYEFLCAELDAIAGAVRSKKWEEVLLRLNGRRMSSTMVQRLRCGGYTGAKTGYWSLGVLNCNCGDRCDNFHRPFETVDRRFALMLEDSGDASTPEARAARGMIHEARGDFPEALAEYEQAGAKAPDKNMREWAKVRAARMVLGMREPAKAREMLRSLSKEGTNARAVAAGGFAELAYYESKLVERRRQKKGDEEAIGHCRQSAEDFRTAYDQATDMKKWRYGKECALMHMRLVEMGGVTEGLPQYYRKAHDLLLEISEAALAPHDVRSESLFWSAECLRKGGWPEDAKVIFRRVTGEYPETKWAKYARGLLLRP